MAKPSAPTFTLYGISYDKSDDGAGVAIWLSKQLAGKVANTGVRDQRMMWVQFDINNAPPVVVVAAYCPCVRPGRAYTQEMFLEKLRGNDSGIPS